MMVWVRGAGEGVRLRLRARVMPTAFIISFGQPCRRGWDVGPNANPNPSPSPNPNPNQELLSWGPPPGAPGHGKPSGVALDVGAGIGRVSSDVLLERFAQVELL